MTFRCISATLFGFEARARRAWHLDLAVRKHHGGGRIGNRISWCLSLHSIGSDRGLLQRRGLFDIALNEHLRRDFWKLFPKGRISRYAWSIRVRVWFRYCTVVTMTVERGTYRCGHSGSQRVRNYVISVVTFGMQPLVGQRLRLRMVRYKSYFLHPDCLGNL